jgi:IclR family acetate operon transcriptional repressor
VRSIDAVERVADTLESLALAPDGLAVSEVAEALGVHKATASRLLGTLAARGLVERDRETRRYRLGARFVSLAGAAMTRLPIVSQARSELEHLSTASSETTNLAVLDRLHVVYIDQVTPAQAVVMASWVGRRIPAHASSSGKVLLAFGDEDAREAVLRRRLESLTPQTVTDPGRLRAILDETRRRGYAKSVGELEEGLVTIAAPIVADGRALAAVSCSGPVGRLPARDHAHLARLVMDTAVAISHRVAGRSSR